MTGRLRNSIQCRSTTSLSFSLLFLSAAVTSHFLVNSMALQVPVTTDTFFRPWLILVAFRSRMNALTIDVLPAIEIAPVSMDHRILAQENRRAKCGKAVWKLNMALSRKKLVKSDSIGIICESIVALGPWPGMGGVMAEITECDSLVLTAALSPDQTATDKGHTLIRFIPSAGPRDSIIGPRVRK
ncbi:hypothetical protein P152DRAFT_257122 [Eremomyces bilateralis CBS 781.70]|uniref:Uncharacterized protein n=1 Tax=Eremomyces bilateralis CBS 781.70 TaxID=1392243 RepID=A0A6G1FQR0_9PEZI|nr:uncharacterized protein P152DRAFT_257122 [Eremomyces bilateralis CBS 781.70]KAF1808103.1 hypothetical protein P152DRAFT_257122 [Eremomyces bilateralis CBS 781.70]